MANPVIVLLTDFGLQDAYVGILKGVLLSRCPQASLVDLCHDIPPGDLRRGAYQLWSAAAYFPAGTVFLAVVDPGVGSARAALALQAGGQTYVGPDNGLLSWAAPEPAQIVTLPPLPGMSHTFHGRDLFAPAAARLAAGEPLAALGPPSAGLIRLPRPEPSLGPDALVGEILLWDRFGNGISNLPAAALETLEAPLLIEAGPWSLPLSRTYSDVAPGRPLALIGSSGLLELSLRDGSAWAALAGEPVAVRVSKA